MSEANYKPDGSGVVMGDSKALPNRGTSYVNDRYSLGQPYGASVDASATNSLGSIHDACGSDPIDKDRADNPVFHFPDHREAEGGTHLSGTESDPIDAERNTAPHGGPK